MRVLIVSGPSGVGKSYLANHLTENFDYQRIVPVTTRNPRVSEIPGLSYNFVTIAEYKALEESGDLFMSNEFFNAQYGFQRSEVEKIFAIGLRPVTEIYTPKIAQFVNAYPDSDRIFLMPESLNLIAQRMLDRGDGIEKVAERIIAAEAEIDYFQNIGYEHYHSVIEVKGDESLNEIVAEITRLRNANENNEFKYQVK